ncbi:MAG TPA: bifunctional riboflavin kinase/FAD synthetase [Bacillota bacterium]|nr:bifunctional riboflavin kinase/FAD synthetase [Bacillota bacterium]
MIAAVGVFDGVHLGHKELFRTALDLKKDTQLPVAAVTFSPHPKVILNENNCIFGLLTLEEEKKALLEVMGIDYYWAVPFSREVARLSPEEFVDNYLCAYMETKYIVCGFNFTFGYKGAGTPRYLKSIERDKGFEVKIVPPFEIEGEVVSSTRIRELISDGDVERANRFLGRPYCVYGEVIKGNGVGGQIGVPTSNIDFSPNKLIPRRGVYAVFARLVCGELMPAVANVGVRPTFGGVHTRMEVHIPGFSKELYGEKMQVFFLKYLREEQKFASPYSLKEQIQSDIEEALLVSKSQLRQGFDLDSFTLLSAYDRIFLTK